MRTILDIAQNELRLIFKDQGIWINIVVVPLVLSFVIGIANGGGGSAAGGAPAGPRLLMDVLVEDATGIVAVSPEAAQTGATGAFLADLRTRNTNLLLCPIDNTEDNLCRLDGGTLTAERALTRAEEAIALAQIVLPADFETRVAAGEPVALVYRSNENLTAPGYILQAVQAAALHTGAVQVAVDTAESVVEGFPALVFRDEADRSAFFAGVRENAQAAWNADPIIIEGVTAGMVETEASTGGAPSGGFSQSVPGIGSMYVMLAILPAVGAFIRARREWTLQRLLTTPASRGQILGGMLLARFLLGMIQYGIIFAFGLVLGVRYGSDPVALLLVMLAFTLAVTALMILLTGFIQNEMQASGITLFISLTLAPLGGAWWPLDIVPEWMRTVGYISPIAWAMDGYNALIFQNGGVGDVIVPVAVLLAMAAVCFAIGVRRFRFD